MCSDFPMSVLRRYHVGIASVRKSAFGGFKAPGGAICRLCTLCRRPGSHAGCGSAPPRVRGVAGIVWPTGQERAPQDVGDMTTSCRTRPPRGGCAALPRLGGRGRMETVGEAESTTAGGLHLWPSARATIHRTVARCGPGERSVTGGRVAGGRRVWFTTPPGLQGCDRFGRARSTRPPRGGRVRIWDRRAGGEHDARRLRAGRGRGGAVRQSWSGRTPISPSPRALIARTAAWLAAAVVK